MRQQSNKLKLGKGVSFFVKSQLLRLDQEDETWEADFFPIPCSGGRQDNVWIGLALSHTHDSVLAMQTVEEPPSVNDLAQLLAEAMRRPLAKFAHRPRILYLRKKPEWAELLPHLKQIRIQVISQDDLPMWDRYFGDLYAKVEQARAARGTTLTPGTSRRRKSMARSAKAPADQQPADQGQVRIYTLDVFLPRRPASKAFAKKKSGVSRTIQIRGDQTLEDLHHAIFNAFDRWDEHLYEFQFGKGPKDRQGPFYVLRHTGGDNVGGLVTETTIDSLRLKVGRSFGYLFDFGDNWWHQINVEAIEDTGPTGSFPRVTKRVGKSPSQYAGEDE